MWDWKESISRWSKDKIFDDLCKENCVDSTIYVLGKREVFQIINKSSYDFITKSSGFDDVYPFVVQVTKKQIFNSLSGKKSFLSLEDTNGEIVNKVISRLANNMRNVFDPRYKNCIKDAQKHIRGNLIEQISYESSLDPLSILIMEEDEREYDEMIAKIDKEYVEYICSITKFCDDNQLELNFDDE